MTPDIQEFLHAMHDGHQIDPEKQSLRFGTSGYIPMFAPEKPIKKMLHRINAAVSAMLDSSDWAYTGLWSNRLPKGGFHVKHNHPKGWMSGVCYIDVPNSESGHLEFDNQKIIPETGLVVIFPSKTIHSVSVYEGDAPRLVVAFDLLPLVK